MLLPEGYRIECSRDPNHKAVNVIIPINEPLPPAIHPGSPNAMAQALSQNVGVDAKLRYYDFVKTQFEEQPSVSITFFDIMKEYREERCATYCSFSNLVSSRVRQLLNKPSLIIELSLLRIDTSTVVQRITDLFGLYPALLSAFNIFLPPGYEIVPPKLPAYSINFFHGSGESASQAIEDDAMMAD